MESIVTSLTSSFTEVGSSITGVIGSVLPIALPIIGGILVVTVGIKVFKKVTGKA
ncbi:major coat protein [Ruminococcus gauvreauii]|uniref:major coat protein n=1 Tax=Ruminococcus gauvreauii TaxID=438033 RepID=UPI003983EC7B